MLSAATKISHRNGGVSRRWWSKKAPRPATRTTALHALAVSRTIRATPSCLWRSALFVAIILLCAPNLSVAARLTVLLRFDDVSENSDIAFEKKLFDVLKDLNVQVLIGVIPFPEDKAETAVGTAANASKRFDTTREAFLRHYVETGTVRIALHGYNHQYYDGRSDIPGRPEQRQREMLFDGKAFLERSLGVPVTVFVPPFNRYDPATVAALDNLGFDILSASISPVGSISSKVKCVPGTTYPQVLRATVEKALTQGAGQGLIVVIMHRYDFLESGVKLPEFRGASEAHPGAAQITLDELKQVLQWIRSSPGIEISTFQNVQRTESLSCRRDLANSEWRNTEVSRYGLLPASWGLQPINGLYSPRDVAEEYKTLQGGIALLVYLSIFAAFAIAAYRFTSVLSKLGVVYRWCLFGAIVGSVVAIGGHVWTSGLALKAAMSLVALSGAFAGAVLAVRARGPALAVGSNQ